MQVTISQLTDDEAKLFRDTNRWVDHTRLNNIMMCPRFGILRYMFNKTLDVEPRQVPLECGNAMHQAFAAHRLWQLWHSVSDHSLEYIVHRQGIRIFGEDRWNELSKKLMEDDPQHICLDALYTSGYIDDPRDRKRTLTNMELSLLHYLLRYPHDLLPYVSDDFVGIEVPVRLKLSYDDGVEFAYLGRADAVLFDPRGKLIVVDNKTASNTNNDWEIQWLTSHQITGYCVGISTMLERSVMDWAVVGLQIPLPKGQEGTGYKWIASERFERAVAEWAKWAHHGWGLWERYKDEPFESPQFTHSCYRYFRPCSFIPICDSDEPTTLDEMTDSPWHPEEA